MLINHKIENLSQETLTFRTSADPTERKFEIFGEMKYLQKKSPKAAAFFHPLELIVAVDFSLFFSWLNQLVTHLLVSSNTNISRKLRRKTNYSFSPYKDNLRRGLGFEPMTWCQVLVTKTAKLSFIVGRIGSNQF